VGTYPRMAECKVEWLDLLLGLRVDKIDVESVVSG
jgi:hypothetical protein